MAICLRKDSESWDFKRFSLEILDNVAVVNRIMLDGGSINNIVYDHCHDSSSRDD